MADPQMWKPYLILLKGEGAGFTLLALTLAGDTCYRPGSAYVGLPQGVSGLGPESGNREILKVTLPINRVENEPCYRIWTPIGHVLSHLELHEARPTLIAYVVAKGELKGQTTIHIKDAEPDPRITTQGKVSPRGPDTPFPWWKDNPFPFNVLAVSHAQLKPYRAGSRTPTAGGACEVCTCPYFVQGGVEGDPRCWRSGCGHHILDHY